MNLKNAELRVENVGGKETRRVTRGKHFSAMSKARGSRQPALRCFVPDGIY